MTNLKKIKIYKLCSPTDDKYVYYGSTSKKTLNLRLAGHKDKWNQYRNNNKGNYCSAYILFDNYKDVVIELIEEFLCENTIERYDKESYYITNNKCVNINIMQYTVKKIKKK